jgi:hypothetical protein
MTIDKISATDENVTATCIWIDEKGDKRRQDFRVSELKLIEWPAMTWELISFNTVAFCLNRRMVMADNKDPNEKQPGENKPGKFHFNPGNQAGKTAETLKPASQPNNDRDQAERRDD